MKTLTETGIRILTKRYRSVLRKCAILNAMLFVMGASSAMAVEPKPLNDETDTIWYNYTQNEDNWTEGTYNEIASVDTNVINKGEIDENITLTNNEDKSLTNKDTGYIGHLVNNGTFTNMDQAVVGQTENTGTLNNEAEALISGTVTNNAGTITNAGTISGSIYNAYITPEAGEHVASTVTNTGTITGNIVNEDILNNKAEALISGTVTNNAGTITNAGTISGKITNNYVVVEEEHLVASNIINTGFITGGVENSDSFINQNTGIVRDGDFNNYATGVAENDGIILSNVTNEGVFNNYGAISGKVTNGKDDGSVAANFLNNGSLLEFTNEANSTLENNGTISKSLTNKKDATVENKATIAGVIANAGTFNNEGDLLSDVTNAGEGAILTTSADHIKHVVTNKNGAELALDGGTLVYDVLGKTEGAEGDTDDGKITLKQDVENKADVATGIIGLDANLTGTGTLALSGTNNISAKTSTITQSLVSNTGTLTANVDQIDTYTQEGKIINTGSLSLIGGGETEEGLPVYKDQNNAIEGIGGNTTLSGNIINKATIEQKNIANTGNLINEAALGAKNIVNEGNLFNASTIGAKEFVNNGNFSNTFGSKETVALNAGKLINGENANFVSGLANLDVDHKIVNKGNMTLNGSFFGNNEEVNEIDTDIIVNKGNLAINGSLFGDATEINADKMVGDGDLTLTGQIMNTADISQTTITNFGSLENGADIVATSLVNNGHLKNVASLEPALDGSIIAETVTNNVWASLESDASKLKANVTNNGTLTFTGGEFDNHTEEPGDLGPVTTNGTISGFGTLNITGATKIAANNEVSQTALFIGANLTNNGNMTVNQLLLNSQDGLEKNGILGTGNLTLNGWNNIAFSDNVIEQGNLINNGLLTAKVGQITTTGGINNTGSLVLNGVEGATQDQGNVIAGTGNLTFTGTVNNTGAITQTTVTNFGSLENGALITAATINNNMRASLTSNADNLKANIINNGTLTFTSGKFDNHSEETVGEETVITNGTISGFGALNVAGDATIAANNTISQSSVSVAENAALTNEGEISAFSIANEGTLKSGVDTIHGFINNNGTMELASTSTTEDPSLQTNVIFGEGTTAFSGNIKNVAAITQGEIVNTEDTEDSVFENNSFISANVTNTNGAEFSNNRFSMISGDVVNEKGSYFENNATIFGNVTNTKGANFDNNAYSMILGNITNEKGSDIVNEGMIFGDITNTTGADLYNEAYIAGDITNDKGASIVNNGMLVGDIINNSEMTSNTSWIFGSVANNGENAVLNLNEGGKQHFDLANNAGTVNVAGDFEQGANKTITNTGIINFGVEGEEQPVNVVLTSGIASEKTPTDEYAGTVNFATGSSLTATLTDTTLDKPLIAANKVDFGDYNTINITPLDSNNLANKEHKLIDAATIDDIDNVTFGDNKLYNFALTETEDGSINGSIDVSVKTAKELLANGSVKTLQEAATISAIANTAGDGTKQGNKIADSISNVVQSGNKVAAAVKAAQDLAPTTSQVVMGVAQSVNSTLSNVASSRMAEGRASGDTFIGGAMWAQGLMNHTKQDSSSSTDGFTADTTGISFGIDGKVNEDLMIGIGYGYTNTDADAGSHDIDVDGHNFFIYSEYKPSNWYVNGMLSYGMNSYEERKAPMGVSLKAKYDVNTYAANVMAGYDFDNGITPEFGLRYLLADQDSYNDGAQRISTDNNDLLTGVVGVKYKKDMTAKDWKFMPNLRLAATYDMISDNTKANVRVIGGESYQITGKRLERFGVETGIGVEATYGDWNLSLDYNAGFRDDFTSHTGMLKAKYNF